MIQCQTLHFWEVQLFDNWTGVGLLSHGSSRSASESYKCSNCSNLHAYGYAYKAKQTIDNIAPYPQ